MKKSFIIILIVLVFMSFALIGCEGVTGGINTELASLQIHPTSPTSFDANQDINLSQIRIIATYKDGTEEILQLNDAMLSDSDREKFTTIAASHTIRIEYKGKAVLYNFWVSEAISQTKYNAHFEPNGGTDVASQYTNLIQSFTIPIRHGFTFIGWFDNVELEGTKAEAPYPLYRDTTFFAKWQNNQQWTVTFLDYQGNPIPGYSQTIVHDNDVPYLPDAPEVEGYVFQGWEGPIYNVTENIQVESIYERIYFDITIYADEAMQTRLLTSPPIPYGDTYQISNLPDLPEVEGHIGEWKIYTPYGFEDIEDQFNSIKSDYVIVPHYRIIRFSITFQDDSAFAGTGTSWSNIIRQVDYGSDFNLLEAGNPNITSPQERTGHIANWAVLLNEQWININDGSVWDEEEKVWIPAGEPISLINILNTSSEVIASISNGYLIQEIKGNIQIQAKYEREEFNLRFYRIINETSVLLYEVTDINYGTKFSLYQTEGEPDPDIEYGTYSKQDFVMHNALDDWDIEWYTSAEFNDDEKIVFEDNGYIMVESQTSEKSLAFYCLDIDLRVYEVQFYDWDFDSEEYVLLSAPMEIDGEIQNVETQIVPFGGSAIAPNVSSKVERGYDLVEYWYDAPHDKGYAERIYITNIEKNTRFYTRYRLRTYNVVFRDFYYPYDDNENADDLSVIESLPEVTYYTGEEGQPLSYGYITMEAVYLRDHGYEFTDSEVYFGGDEIYQKIQTIEQYEADEDIYDNLLAQLDDILDDIDNYSTLIDDYRDYEIAILEYQTDDERWIGYEKPDYDTYMSYRENLYEAEQKLNFINNYKIQYYEGESGEENPDTGSREREYMLLRYERETEGGEYLTDENGNFIYKTDIEGKYIDNGDYQRMLNLFYEIEGREGYEFDGWFTNPNFNVETRVSENVLDDIETEFTVTNNVFLFAKWIDLEKGSDGLVFEKVEEPNPDYEVGGSQPEFLTYYIVIDYIDIADIGDYTLIEIEGEEYYQFTDRLTDELRIVHHNLISFNEITQIQETELRIPAFHNGLPVKRIRGGALNERGEGIERVSIPSNIEVIDEGVFSSCYELTAFTLSEENENFVIVRGVLYNASETILICYPAKLDMGEYEYNTNIVPTSTYIIPAQVIRIAKGAFSNSNLMYIAFEPGVLGDELVIGEEAFKGCLDLRRVGYIMTTEREIEGSEDTETIYISDFTLPDRLVGIEAKAFYGCQYIINFEANETSQLIYVGEDAFEATTWLNNLKETPATSSTYYVDGETDSGGIITIGYVVLGVTNLFNNDTLTLDATYTRAVADGAFYNNPIIKTIEIKNSNFKHIGKDAFRKIMNLTRVDIYVEDPSTTSIGSKAFGSSGYLNIYVPEGSVPDYETEQGWSEYAGQYNELE